MRIATLVLAGAFTAVAAAQGPPPPPPIDPARVPAGMPMPKVWTAAEDHANMKEQLGITALRPGPSGNEQAPNHANYDEALANPYPDLPGVLTLKNGKNVTSAAEWNTQRRPEIVEEFDREVLGRVPKNVPKVMWEVTSTTNTTLGGMPVVVRKLTGRVDNARFPAIDVNIEMGLVTPADIKTPVPVMIMFGGAFLLPGWTPPPGGRGFGAPPANAAATDLPATQQLIAGGWGYAALNPASVQADNGAGLTRGIVGLVNAGQPRKPDDWGALRAWAWGASRALDYLETDTSVDAKKVGIEGVSRYGKAALVTMAYDQRFALVLVGSSGEGGAKLHRRNWGEAVENLTGSGEYHWMAGNFLKYGTEASSFGRKTAGDIPVDAHELIALCAPRPTFISYGVPEKGDAKWLDHQGSFMAAIAAQPVFRLLGAKDLGRTDDSKTEKMPAVNVSMLDGQLAWRQHDGGHTDGPNWRYFIPWANRMLTYMPSTSATRPVPRVDANSVQAHKDLLEKAKAGGVDVYFEGDSIARRWGAIDYPDLLANWKQNFFGWNAGDFAWGADRVEHVLWRLQNGELDGLDPKVVVLLAGTNNVGGRPGDAAKVDDITAGLKRVVDLFRDKTPNATIVVMGIFPRNDNMAVMPEIAKINASLAKMADGKKVRYLNINDTLADKDGTLYDGMMNADKLHPALKGYQAWAGALKPILLELLGAPAATDHAPPPTGDPSAVKRGGL